MKTFPEVPGKPPEPLFRGLFFAETRKCPPTVNGYVKNDFVDPDREWVLLLYKSFKCTKMD